MDVQYAAPHPPTHTLTARHWAGLARRPPGHTFGTLQPRCFVSSAATTSSKYSSQPRLSLLFSLCPAPCLQHTKPPFPTRVMHRVAGEIRCGKGVQFLDMQLDPLHQAHFGLVAYRLCSGLPKLQSTPASRPSLAGRTKQLFQTECGCFSAPTQEHYASLLPDVVEPNPIAAYTTVLGILYKSHAALFGGIGFIKVRQRRQSYQTRP